MVHCTDPRDCDDHGDCVDSRCSCDMGWFGENCSTPGTEAWGHAWTGFRILFAISYTLFCLWASYRVRKSAKLRTSGLSLKAVLLTPKYMSLCWLICAGLLRSFWLFIDPLGFNSLCSRLADRMVYVMVFPMIYVGYTNVLLVWYESRRVSLYQGVQQEAKDRTRVFRWVLVVILVLSFPVSVVTAVAKGLRVGETWLLRASYIFMCFAVCVIVSGLCLFAFLLVRSLQSECLDYSFEADTMDHSVPASPKMVETQLDTIPQTTERSLDEEELQPALRRATICIRQQKRHVTLAPFSPCLFQTARERQWSVSNSSSNQQRSVEKFSWSQYHSFSGNSHRVESSEQDYQRGAEVKEHYVVAVSGRDRSVLQKIIAMTVGSAILGVLILLISVLLSTVRSAFGAKATLAVLWLSSVMELLALVLIALIFTMEIKVKPKENLLFVSELARKLEKMKATVEIDPDFRKLAVRLNSYLGVKKT